MFDGLSFFNESTLAIICIFAAPIAMFYCIYKIIASCNKRKADLALAEQGINPRTGENRCCGGVIVWGTSLIGLGLGIGLASLFENDYAQIAITIALLGAGMLAGYYLKACGRCKCGKNCKCGDDCKCDAENKCNDDCTCGKE